MQVLSTRTYRFVNPEKGDVTVAHSPRIQSIPDHVAEDPYFAMACADGSLTVIEVAAAPAASVPAAEPEAVPAAEPQAPASDKPKSKK